MKRTCIPFLIAVILAACVPSTPSPSIINVYATPHAQPWLPELYDCAASASVVLNMSPDAPDILLRVGEPQDLTAPAFQIGTEDILVVVHRQNPLQNSTPEGVRAVFAQGDPALQIWVYAGGDDVQGVFEKAVMEGGSVVSSAQVAAHPQQMSDLLNANHNAVGILSRHWKVGNTREVYTIASVPVLAITPAEPSGVIRELLACLQK